MNSGAATSDSLCPWEYRGMIENSVDPVGFVDESGNIMYANGRLRSLLGSDNKESRIRRTLLAAAALCRKDQRTVTETLTLEQGKRVFDLAAIPSLGDDALRPGSILALRDITAAIDEKRSLLNELHHRVKNNLMTIASLVSLKDDEVGDRADLSDIRRQIDSIAMVHDQLYVTDGVLEVALSDYLTGVFRSTVPPEVAQGTVECEEIVVPSKVAAYLGLIVNELATNAVKHGIDESVAKPEIALRVGFDPHDRLTIKVSNTGRSFPLHNTLWDTLERLAPSSSGSM